MDPGHLATEPPGLLRILDIWPHLTGISKLPFACTRFIGTRESRLIFDQLLLLG